MDYNETFDHVARLDTIRTLSAFAAQKSWKEFSSQIVSEIEPYHPYSP